MVLADSIENVWEDFFSDLFDSFGFCIGCVVATSWAFAQNIRCFDPWGPAVGRSRMVNPVFPQGNDGIITHSQQKIRPLPFIRPICTLFHVGLYILGVETFQNWNLEMLSWTKFESRTEQWKMGPWLFRVYVGDEIQPFYVGIISKTHENKGPYWRN